MAATKSPLVQAMQGLKEALGSNGVGLVAAYAGVVLARVVAR